MISKELNNIFQKSIILAKELRHEYLTIEHIFYIVLNSKEGSQIILACGGDIAKMKQLLGIYIKNEIETLPQGIEDEPYETVALSRLIDNMIKHLQSSSKTTATVGDILVAL
ncbi:MAG: Clp protease N-terminal domain-containing protein, partial [Campylobacterales bacterium]